MESHIPARSPGHALPKLGRARHLHLQGPFPGNPSWRRCCISPIPLGPSSPANRTHPQSALSIHNQPLVHGSGSSFKGHLISTRHHLVLWDVGSSSMQSQQPADPGTFVLRMASTLVQPWTPTTASSLSMLTPKARSSLTQLNSATPSFPSHPLLWRTDSFTDFK